MRRTMIIGLSILVVAVTAGCSMFGRGSKTQDRFARPGTPRNSPSGTYVASVEENDAKAWTIVITDSAGTEVFRDGYAYGARYAVGVSWLSTKDQLWILSPDVGTAYVEAGPDGTWSKTSITPQTRDLIPEEIAKLK